MTWRIRICVLTVCGAFACSRGREPRGYSEPSADSRTYLVVDEAAASGLEHAAYYRHAWANKPDWQGI